MKLYNMVGEQLKVSGPMT